jgi:prepilin-type N-terminal cleavage/methylation domain-containing protein
MSLLERTPSEAGFTLIELLVSMIAGLVVLSALFTILDVTLHNTTRTFTKVDATQRARTTLEKLENELHSACVTAGVTPIQGGGTNGSQDSDGNDLVFVSQYGTSANPSPVEHKIAFNSASKTLTDYTYSVTSGNSPSNWVFSSTPTSANGTQLLTNVTQSGTTPVFQYFAYEPYTDTSGNSDMMIMDGSTSVPGTTTVPNPDPLPTSGGLSTANAASTVEVLITFVVGGRGGSGENTNYQDTNATVSDSVVLRLSPAANQAVGTSTFGPCQ